MFFKDIIGQQNIKERLIRSVRDNRISHAQLFLGPEGCGNLPLALAYAQYVMCKDRQETDSCGTCPSCLKFRTLGHPDVHFSYPVILSAKVKVANDVVSTWRDAIDEQPYMTASYWYEKLGEDNKQGVIGVKGSDEIVKKLVLKSYEGDYKIMIIWLAEAMNIAAANKLLKIIEEPPNKTLFLLVSVDHEKIISTILSRTQLIKINKLKDEEVTAALVQKNSVGEQEAMSIASLADGNYLRALKLLEEKHEANFNFEHFRNWMRLCFKHDVLGTIDWVDTIATLGRERQKNFLQFGLHIFRQSIAGSYGSEDMIRLQGEELGFAKKFAPFINGKNILKLSEEFNTAHYHIERNANPKILFLDLSFKLFRLIKA
jgi:DNA polymerase-3 subunit delta'